MRARVLIVDDEKSLRDSLAKYLASKGYAVAGAGGPEEALGRLRDSSFDLVLVDLHLGTDSGLDLLQSMAEKGHDAPVIVLSAFGTFDNSVQAMRLGAVDFLKKPFGLAELEARISNALEESRRESELDYLRHGPQTEPADPGLLGHHPTPAGRLYRV